jgi:hypothetical protein
LALASCTDLLGIDRSYSEVSPSADAAWDAEVDAALDSPSGATDASSRPDGSGITLRGATTVRSSFQTKVTLVVPDGTQPGDTMIAMLTLADGLLAAPAGWTKIAEGGLCSSGYLVSWLVRTAAAEPPSYTFNGRGQAGSFLYGIMVTLSGVDPNVPIDVTSDFVRVLTGDPYSSPSVTTTVPGDTLLFGVADQTAAIPATWAVPKTMSLVATSGVLALFQGTAANAGPTPIVTTSDSPPDGSVECGGVDVIALRPAR